jgi:ABC-type Zn uptake system ZnuABC Zn-binding protein ZnuA/ABC-type Mn2+/Zn2+ transport system ATPase subunit
MKRLFCFLFSALPLMPLGARPKLVATINILADMATQVAGNHLEVVSLLPSGTDPHTYEPRPGDAALLARADVILTNGLHLEGWLEKLIQSAGGKAEILVASRRIDAIRAQDYSNSFDPHAWMSFSNAIRYIQEIEAALGRLYPALKQDFARNADAYTAELLLADQQLRQAFQKIPPAARYIITSHDAFRYFAREYGFQVASVMGTSTDADVSLKDINHLIQVIRENRVPAMFVEVALNPKILQQLARDLGVRIGGSLYTDSFGPPGSDADSYLKMMQFNASVLLSALSPAARAAEPAIDRSGIIWMGGLMLLVFALAWIWLKKTVYPQYREEINWKDYLLKVRDLVVMLDQKVILSNLFLELQPGRFYGILGSNGSGKSTLVKTLVGLHTPVSGSVQINGKPIGHFLRHIAYLPQKEEFDMNFPATVQDLVQLGFFPEQSGTGLSRHQKARLAEVLQKLEIENLADRQISQLSGGQFQRALLARALCQNAEILILDEPFVGVDFATEEIIMNLLREEVAAGKMVLMVHHDLTRVRNYFDHLIMVNQRIVAYGPTEEVFTEANIQATYSGKVTLLQKALQLIKPELH